MEGPLGIQSSHSICRNVNELLAPNPDRYPCALFPVPCTRISSDTVKVEKQ